MNNCYISLAGGLGNQLFQIAAGYAYAKEYGKNLVVYTQNWSGSQGKHPDTYRNTLYKNFKFTHHISDTYTNIFEKRFNYDPIPFVKGSVCLHGYFQSLKYFINYKDEFINQLSFKEYDSTFLVEGAAAAHVRRGDYIQHANIHLVCGTEYFLRNMERFENVNIFSDSLEKVQLEFKDTTCKYVETNSELLELYLMSQHDNMICSNSSFSWWASLLGKPKNTIIVPNIWFKNFEEHHDIYRPEFLISEV